MLDLSFKLDRSYTTALALNYFLEAVLVDPGTPLAVTYSGNTESNWNAAIWTDSRAPKPTWIEIQGYFSSWLYAYNSAPVKNSDLHNFLDNQVNIPLNSKADASSVTSALSTKVNGLSGMYLHATQATSDSSSVVTIHLTVDGLFNGAALFSGIPKLVATGKDSTGSPIASPQVAELAWSNSNKTVTFKTSRATNMLLLGNSAVATGAGAVVDIIAYGLKA